MKWVGRIFALTLLISSASIADEGRFNNATSAPQPDKARLIEISEQGYAAVIDLRLPSEDRGIDEATEVAALGMDYVSLPVSGTDGITVANANTLAALIEKYDAPVLIHCGSGNRVGALMAIEAGASGASVEEAVAIGKQFRLTRLEGRVREVLEEDGSADSE